MTKPFLNIAIIAFVAFSCKKADTNPVVEPIKTSLINDQCLVTKSEVAYDKILDTKRDGFVRVEQIFDASGRFVKGNAIIAMFGDNIGENYDLKKAKFNDKSFTIALNNFYNFNFKTKVDNAHWKFTLPDNTELEICINKIPKVLVLNKITLPTPNKDWQLALDISDNQADEIVVSDNSFMEKNYSRFFFKVAGTETTFNETIEKEYLAYFFENLNAFNEKKYTIYAKASKDYLTTVKGKKIHIIVDNITQKEVPYTK
jgi:hypothetical protein